MTGFADEVISSHEECWEFLYRDTETEGAVAILYPIFAMSWFLLDTVPGSNNRFSVRSPKSLIYS